MKRTTLQKARLLGIGLTLVSITSLGGCKACGGDSGGEADATASAIPSSSVAAMPSASASTSAREAMGDRRMPVNAGPYTFLFATARTLPLKEEQKAKVEAAVALVRAEDAHDETRGLRTEIATQVKAGKIEPGKLETHYAAIDKATKARQDKEAEAVNALHAALEPAQRAEVVSTARARQAKRGHKNPDGGTKALADRMAKRRIERIKHVTELDEAQMKKIEALSFKEEAVDQEAETSKRNETILAAFEKDDFDAKKIDPPDPKKARAVLQREPQFLAQIVPILTPAQREKLAADIERSLGGGHGRRPLRHLDRLPGGDDDEP